MTSHLGVAFGRAFAVFVVEEATGGNDLVVVLCEEGVGAISGVESGALIFFEEEVEAEDGKLVSAADVVFFDIGAAFDIAPMLSEEQGEALEVFDGVLESGTLADGGEDFFDIVVFSPEVGGGLEEFAA